MVALERLGETLTASTLGRVIDRFSFAALALRAARERHQQLYDAAIGSLTS